jgi:hypothetical protein
MMRLSFCPSRNKGTAEQGSQRIGDKLSPTEIARCRWQAKTGLKVTSDKIICLPRNIKTSRKNKCVHLSAVSATFPMRREFIASVG